MDSGTWWFLRALLAPTCRTGECSGSPKKHHKPQCTTCDRNRGGCPHVVAAGKVGPEKGDKTAELESRFQAFFDGERGCRRLTCRSRVAIPPDIKTSQYAEKYRGTLPPMLRT